MTSLPFDYTSTRVVDSLDAMADVTRAKQDCVVYQQAIATELQALEDALRDLAVAFDLSTAVGSQLNALGEILGLDRNGATDANYRLLLAAQQTVLRGSGTTDDLNTLVRLIMEANGFPSPHFIVRTMKPLSVEVTIYDNFTGDRDQLATVLRNAVDAGVEFRLRTANNTPIFRLDTVGAMDQAHMIDERS